MIGKSLGLIEKKQNREDLKQMKLRNFADCNIKLNMQIE